MQAIHRSPATLRAAQLLRRSRAALHGVAIATIGYAVVITIWALLALSLFA